MSRSIKGLEGAGEWHVVKSLLPDLRNKSVLDLGCGFGWYCRFAREQQASSVVGVDLSEKMLEDARKQTHDPAISYLHMPIEDIEFPNDQFDVVFSSLAFHYIQSFEGICKKVHECLKPGGMFIFSVEHPIFTSRQEQDWYIDDQGNRLHWPVDHYQKEGLRQTPFLSEHVIKYHRTISTYVNDVIGAGFELKAVKEPTPPGEMLTGEPLLNDENRRPMFFIISAEKGTG